MQQKGSLNAPDRLRFDVSQPRPITADELHWVEAEVNARIRENSEVTTRLMTPEAAVEHGAMALFGEKYGDEVRVVAMGEPDGNKPAWSIELCGGTHVRRTGDIGYFRIVGEAAVAAGVRRIEAVTGASAESAVAEIQAPAERGGGRPARRSGRGARPDRRAVGGSPQTAGSGGGAAEESRHRRRRGGGRSGERGNADGTEFGRGAGEGSQGPGRRHRQAAGVGRGGAGVHGGGQGLIVVAVSADLTGRISAVDLVRAAAAAVGGKGGGGRPDLAQAGGPDGAKADEALAAVRGALQ